MLRKEVQKSEYNDFYGRYIEKVPENYELLSSYVEDKKRVLDFFNSISEEKLEYRYQPEKWSIKEVLQHMIDNERIFAIRLLRIARNDKTSLPGFDENIFIEPSKANQKSKQALLEEFTITRDFSLNIIKSIDGSYLKNIGTVSDSSISVRACAFLIIGHGMWHMNTIKERYL